MFDVYNVLNFQITAEFPFLLVKLYWTYVHLGKCKQGRVGV